MTRPSPFGASIAVVVGIDQYGHGIPTLRTAANDARRMSELLSAFHGYDVVQLIDGEATRERIATLLTRDLPARLGPNDRMLFYWAGHGVALDGDTGPNGYLLPADARRGEEDTFLHMPLVHDALLALQCRHMFIVLDSCFSGAFRWSGTRELGRTDEIVHQEKYERYVRDPAWQVLTSASQDESALDMLSTGALGCRDREGAHSPFAVALFQALEGAADVMGGRDGDGLVTAQELYVYLDDTLQSAAIQAGTRQTPGLWPLRKHSKGQFVFFVPNRELNLPPAPPLTYENNPWRGLAAYERKDATLFFGRDAAIGSLTRAVIEQPFTVVLGASGSGKSSLVKAGVFPRLEALGGFHVLPDVRPGDAPIAAIADAVSTISPGGKRPVGTGSIVAAISMWCKTHPDQRLVLMIDQTEELVTMVRTSADRDTTLQLIEALLKEHGDRVRIVLTLRTDYEPQFDRNALSARWRAARFVVPPMSRADLQAVIEEPAARRVLYFDPPALVETLLDEVTNMPGALPLLSFALSEMYIRYVQRRASDRALTRDDYDYLGGVVGALRSRADSEYDALSADKQRTMQHMMLRMVGGGGGNLARRRVHDRELVFRDAAENERVKAVRKRLVEARLLVEGKDAEGDPYVEPAHDALVRAWGRLIQWIQQVAGDAVPLAMRQKLAREADDWKRATDKATKNGLLWKDRVRSSMLAPVVRAKAAWLNAAEMEFAERSVQGWKLARLGSYGVTATVTALAIVSLLMWRQSESNYRGMQISLTKAESATVVANSARKDAERSRERAEAEKVHTMRNLFSSLMLGLGGSQPGGVCVVESCGAPTTADSAGWVVLARVPETIPPNNPRPVTRDYMASREYGQGKVLVYAHDGITHNDVLRDVGIDGRAANVTIVENALRWLSPMQPRAGCTTPTTSVALWQGYVNGSSHSRMLDYIRQRGWTVTMTSPESLEQDLRCAGVLWFGNVWDAPADFASTYMPVIARFVRDGGGLLVAGLGWSFEMLRKGQVYPVDQVGDSLGFRFTRDAFVPQAAHPVIPLLNAQDLGRVR